MLSTPVRMSTVRKVKKVERVETGPCLVCREKGATKMPRTDIFVHDKCKSIIAVTDDTHCRHAVLNLSILWPATPWTPKLHRTFPIEVQEEIKTMLFMWNRTDCIWSFLDRNVVLIIASFVATPTIYDKWENKIYYRNRIQGTVISTEYDGICTPFRCCDEKECNNCNSEFNPFGPSGCHKDKCDYEFRCNNCDRRVRRGEDPITTCTPSRCIKNKLCSNCGNERQYGYDDSRPICPLNGPCRTFRLTVCNRYKNICEWLKCPPIDCDEADSAWFWRQRVQLMKLFVDQEVSMDPANHLRIMKAFKGFGEMIKDLEIRGKSRQ